MKKKFNSCFSMTEDVVKQINDNIQYAKDNDFDVERVKALNSGSTTQILTSIAYSLSIIADILTEVREEDK